MSHYIDLRLLLTSICDTIFLNSFMINAVLRLNSFKIQLIRG
jgi:hypothetical protein